MNAKKNKGGRPRTRETRRKQFRVSMAIDIIDKQRTDSEWLWQKLAIFFMIAFGISCIITLLL